MSRIDISITPLTAKSPDEDVRACAAIINRRHQYEPNRLHDLTRPEEERLARKIRQLTRHLHESRTCAYVAKINASGEVVGWISWRKPQSLVRVTSDTSNAMAQVPSKTCIKKPEDDRDYEVDHEAIELVNKEKKVKEAHFFGTDPFWVLCHLFSAPHVRRAGIGSKLVVHFLSVVQAQDPQARIGFTSSPMARTLYEKHGFRAVAWFEYTYDDTDENGTIYKHRTRWPYMSNYYEGHEAEVEAAQGRKAFNGPAELDPELV